MSTEIQFTGDVTRLQPGQPVEAELNGGEGHRYEADLEAGQYVHLVADQRGVDVVLRLRTPEGNLVEVDGPTGDHGPEQLFTIPQMSGRFPIEIVSTDTVAPVGRYEVKLNLPRPASEADRRHVQAFQLYLEGDGLRRQNETAAARQAVAKYQEALAIWRELANQEWQAESLFRIGDVRQNRLQELDQALATWQEALPLFRSLGQRDKEGIALNWSGAIELRKGRVQEAIELHRQALAIFHDIGRPGLEAGALNNLGGAYDMADEPQKGLAAYRLGLDRARTALRYPEEVASSFRGIGEILLVQGQYGPAMDSLNSALEIFRTQEPPTDAAHVLSRMAAISQRLGRLDDALTQLQEALSILQSTGDHEGQVVTLNSLGTIHLLKGETGEAGKAYDQALALARNNANRYGEAMTRLNLGRHQFDLGNPREALRFHEQSAVLFQEIGFRRGEVSTLFGCARALHALGDFEAARQHLDKVVNGVEMLRAESENRDLRKLLLCHQAALLRSLHRHPHATE